MTGAAPWPKASAPQPLSSDAVHVWRARLDRPAWRVRDLAEVLSPDERERAERFRLEHLGRHFIVGRALLRLIVGGYIGRAPDELRFAYAARGKPRLADADGSALRFNLAHSGGLALYAVTRIGEVGIDVEQIRSLDDAERIAERFFSVSEIAALRALAPDLRPEAFFRCWTRKEAYVKARGEGLSIPLDQFDVSLAPDEPARLLESRVAPEEAARWSLAALDPGPGYVAALAVAGRDWRLSRWRWTAASECATSMNALPTRATAPIG